LKGIVGWSQQDRVCNVFSRFSDYFDGRNRASPNLDRGDGPGSGHHFNPNQPRVPKGNPEGGQWTEGGAGSVTQPSDEEPRSLGKPWIRLASNEGPRGNWRGHLLLAFVQLFQMILDYRKENPPRDLFGPRDDQESTVAITTVGDKHIIGVNSKQDGYTISDRAAAISVRTALIRKYPDVLDSRDVGRMPANSLFHAEATALLRAANANRGSLNGRTLHVVTDRALCKSCKDILPLLGLELGDPTVIFMDPTGTIHEMKNGKIRNWTAP
jgi:hypothetical protein